MDMNSAFPSEYLRACDLQGKDFTLKMRSVSMAEMQDGERKPVVYFEGADKGLILNKTNCNAIIDLYGSDSDKWIGQEVILFPTQTDFQGRQVECIRVRLRKPAPAVPQEPSGSGEDTPF